MEGILGFSEFVLEISDFLVFGVVVKVQEGDVLPIQFDIPRPLELRIFLHFQLAQTVLIHLLNRVEYVAAFTAFILGLKNLPGLFKVEEIFEILLKHLFQILAPRENLQLLFHRNNLTFLEP